MTPSAGSHGSISPATPQTVNHGETTSFSLTPAANYHIDTVTGCGGKLDGSTYTTGAVESDCAVAAAFAIDTHTVTPFAGTHGSISPATPQTVNHGDITAFTLTPEANYHIDTVNGCGGTLVGGTYTTGAVTGNCTVIASFSDTYALNIALIGSGKGTVTSDPVGIVCLGDCDEQYDVNSTITLTATPKGRSKFRGWSGDCEGTDLSCTVIMDQARNVTAEFYSFPWTMFLPTIINNAKP